MKMKKVKKIKKIKSTHPQWDIVKILDVDWEGVVIRSTMEKGESWELEETLAIQMMNIELHPKLWKEKLKEFKQQKKIPKIKK